MSIILKKISPVKFGQEQYTRKGCGRAWFFSYGKLGHMVWLRLAGLQVEFSYFNDSPFYLNFFGIEATI